jgi:hypothetical protein
MACTRGRRQPFPCGHKGFGAICHRCQKADDLLRKAAVPKAENAEAMKLEAARLKLEAARLKLVPGKKPMLVATA